jgi:hypothetical protein
MTTETWNPTIDDTSSAVSWKAIVAGSTASIAISLALAAFGVGVEFSVVSPWSDSGVSGTTFTIAGGVYLIVVAMLSSTIGGYLAGRLRSQWKTVHEDERYFRDSAHGFLVWAFAAVVSAAVLGGVFTHILAGASAGLVPAATSAAQGLPTDVYVDKLLRADPMQASGSPAVPAAQRTLTSPAPNGETVAPLQGGQTAGFVQGRSAGANRPEITRILLPGVHKGGTVADADRAYLAKVVSARTGLSQADADQRVNQVITEAKTAADAARKSAAAFSLWLVIAMLAGALSASLAAIEGGNLRNREWYLTNSNSTRVVAPAE